MIASKFYVDGTQINRDTLILPHALNLFLHDSIFLHGAWSTIDAEQGTNGDESSHAGNHQNQLN